MVPFRTKFEFKSWKTVLFRVVTEIAVVSFGVYLGTMFADHKAAQEEKLRQTQIYTALIQELDVFAATGELTAQRFEAYVAGWEQQYAAGEHPRPPVFSATGIEMPPHSMWDATVASDGLSHLPIPTVYAASQFYHALNMMESKYDDVFSFGNTRIIPFTSTSLNPFYTQAGALNPEFEAYTLRFKDVVRLLSFLAEQSQDVKQTMQSELDALLAAY
ncbi:hypothetical protein HQ496_11560 [bacterium]|nr:hypothetical protein [bacterium]